jgi:hypothetical protein
MRGWYVTSIEFTCGLANSLRVSANPERKSVRACDEPQAQNIVTKKSNSGGKARRVPGQGRDLTGRDFKGYGAHPPRAVAWRRRDRGQFNLNVEAGGERCILEGDSASEHV